MAELTESAWAAANHLLNGAMKGGLLCAAVFGFGKTAPAAEDQFEAIGHLEPVDGAPNAALGTIFDLASLTKVVATLPVILTLVASREIHLDDPVRRFLPQFERAGAERISIRQLLAHTSGLPPARRYYQTLTNADAARAAVLAEQPVTPPGEAVTYSDLGFMLLGFVAEAVAGDPLDVLAQRLVFTPLGMSRTGFRPRFSADVIAPTEIFGDGPAVRGVVHDRNAALLGGVAGHAGLFAPAADLLRYLRAWFREADPPWGRGLSAQALSRQSPPGTAARGLGWVLADPAADTFLSARWPIGGAGHTGFTGTSIAFHPDTTMWAVLLTNAIRRGRNHVQLQELRRQFHCRVAAWADGNITATSATAPNE